MDVRNSLASQAYQTARTAASPQPRAPGGADAAIGQFVNSFAATLQTGEATARQAMTGGADPQALVQALASSQMAVETVVTVRDRVVEAYQEILRMPV